MGAGAAGRVRSGGAQCRRDRHIHRRAEANGTIMVIMMGQKRKLSFKSATAHS